MSSQEPWEWWERPTLPTDPPSSHPPPPPEHSVHRAWIITGVVVAVLAVPGAVLLGHSLASHTGVVTATAPADTSSSPDPTLLGLLPTGGPQAETPSPAPSPQPSPSPTHAPSPSPSPRRSPSPSHAPSPSPKASPSPAGAFTVPVATLTSVSGCHETAAGAWVLSYTFTVRGTFHELSWDTGGAEHDTGVDVGRAGAAGTTSHSGQAIVAFGGDAPADGTPFTAVLGEQVAPLGQTSPVRSLPTQRQSSVKGCGPASPSPQASPSASPSPSPEPGPSDPSDSPSS